MLICRIDKAVKLIFLLLLICAGIQAFSKEVNLKDAGKVAVNFYYTNNNLYNSVKYSYSDVKITGIYTEWDGSEPVYYIFNINETGFIIISAEDKVYPVLGYSYESACYSGNQSPEFRYWMKGYKDQIVYARNDGNIHDKKAEDAWHLYLSDEVSHFKLNKSNTVGPLLLRMGPELPL